MVAACLERTLPKPNFSCAASKLSVPSGRCFLPGASKKPCFSGVFQSISSLSIHKENAKAASKQATISHGSLTVIFISCRLPSYTVVRGSVCPVSPGTCNQLVVFEEELDTGCSWMFMKDGLVWLNFAYKVFFLDFWRWCWEKHTANVVNSWFPQPTLTILLWLGAGIHHRSGSKQPLAQSIANATLGQRIAATCGNEPFAVSICQRRLTCLAMVFSDFFRHAGLTPEANHFTCSVCKCSCWLSSLGPWLDTCAPTWLQSWHSWTSSDIIWHQPWSKHLSKQTQIEACQVHS